MSSPLSTPAQELIEGGVHAITAVDYRWLKCDVKSTSLLGNCLLRQVAADAGALEVVMFRDGQLTEGSSSNVFVVKNGVILAPPKNNLVLPGITYDVVLELAKAHGLPHEVRQVSEAEVRDADEIWVTSSTKEVLAVTTLDERAVGGGKPGPVFKRMHQLYQDFKRTVMRQAA
jgi:D-alanine transaminase